MRSSSSSSSSPYTIVLNRYSFNNVSKIFHRHRHFED
ncbi:hypothetical protein QR98_0105550 [Sarcoptes scabiei]|uniref:Uncharacterized protein n=1 Tax=Sarcoptes scabiei TaxID=52283 RepID=A0A132AMT4_SARSC|nr:hypothetical protein QR98_0105550 [Sarcoptes scabiei]